MKKLPIQYCKKMILSCRSTLFHAQLHVTTLLLVLLVLLSGCRPSAGPQLRLSEPLLPRRAHVESGQQQDSIDSAALETDAQSVTRIVTTPPALDFSLLSSQVREKEPLTYPHSKAAEVNFHDLPLAAFINEVYGNILGLTFEIEPKLAKQQDLITLRTATPQLPAELDNLARQVLGNYGVAVLRQGEVLRFVAAAKGQGEVPLLVSGRALPEVPASHRPVFQLVPLVVVRNVHVKSWLTQAFKGQDLEIFEDPERNAILLKGTAGLIEQALSAITFLDQPYMRGRQSLRIEPVYLNATELAGLLVDVLNTEGYSASLKPPMGSIIILPVVNINAVLVFAAEERVLEHIKQWALNLDKPGKQADDKGLFFYDVKNTTAADIAKVVNELLSGKIVGSSAPATGKDGKAQVATSLPVGPSQRLVVDEQRNSLIYQGEARQWQEILGLIRNFDQPAKQVLIEVTIAEVTLTDDRNVGIEWLVTGVDIGDLSGVAQTLGGLGIGGAGFSYTLDSAGQTRALLNAFASENLVNIVSTPRVMVKSGMDARIDVGTDVPIITSQQSSSELSTSGDTGILQTIEYRKTGVLLSVKPVVFSTDRVDLVVSQEISEVSSKSASDVQSPSILTRRIETSLTLRDGGSVLLGGLISTTSTDDSSGIPLLMDIPLLGRLFRVDSTSETRTMLVMLIVPYIIDNDREARAVTEAMQNQLPLAPKMMGKE